MPGFLFLLKQQILLAVGSVLREFLMLKSSPANMAGVNACYCIQVSTIMSDCYVSVTWLLYDIGTLMPSF